MLLVVSFIIRSPLAGSRIVGKIFFAQNARIKRFGNCFDESFKVSIFVFVCYDDMRIDTIYIYFAMTLY